MAIEVDVDVLIVGGGPAGLAAALMLGRARKRVLVCDAGPPRNAAAVEIHGFLTRDGTPPKEFRRLAHEELAPYPVTVREARIERVDGDAGGFEVGLAGGEVVRARRVLLASGVVDTLPALPGLPELWGHAVFLCPYCHGWEVRDQAWGFLAPTVEMMTFGLFLRGWTRDLVVFTGGAFEVPAELRARLEAAGVTVETRGLRRLIPGGRNGLDAVELDDGTRVVRDVLVVRSTPRSPALVTAMGLTLDEQGLVRVDDFGETSRRGVYAAGDLTTMMQSALNAAAAGHRVGAMLNHALTMELVESGALP